MSYTEKKKQLADIRKKYSEAKKDRNQLVERHNSIESDLNSAYENYLQTQANAKVRQVPKKEFKSAENAYLKLKNENCDLDTRLDVAERTLSLIIEKLREAEADFRHDAMQHHREVLAPTIQELDQAIQTANSAINNLNEYRHELQKDGLSDSVLQGVKHHSCAVITTKNHGSLGMKDFITNLKTQ